jgi:hypothetical protein
MHATKKIDYLVGLAMLDERLLILVDIEKLMLSAGMRLVVETMH